MNVSRSAFLKLCATALIGVGADVRSRLGGSIVEAAAGTVMPPMDAAPRFEWATASAALFRPHLQTTFIARTTAGGHAALVLDRITEQPHRKGVEQFSLLFTTTRERVEEGLHTLVHPALGEFDLFIAPVGSPRERAVFEACFSRHLPRA